MAPLEIRHRSVRPISAKHAQASRFLQQSLSNLDCKELKSELCDLAKKYRSNLDSGVGIEKIMEEMESARTIKELIKVFG
ncbi:hypothetical protein EWN51_005642 [Escherichia coli]|nr:hypothetical protein [Escherichia coli]EEV0045939.1 hypothetical protein [Escherichia coli]EEV0687658.1 hypothetical protein [Escherichia coli]EEV0689042.1 hypothetical protein [Escherichia coli]